MRRNARADGTIGVEASGFCVELLRAVNIGDGDDDDLELHTDTCNRLSVAVAHQIPVPNATGGNTGSTKTLVSHRDSNRGRSSSWLAT